MPRLASDLAEIVAITLFAGSILLWIGVLAG
jgi:hypothetical protein